MIDDNLLVKSIKIFLSKVYGTMRSRIIIHYCTSTIKADERFGSKGCSASYKIRQVYRMGPDFPVTHSLVIDDNNNRVFVQQNVST